MEILSSAKNIPAADASTLDRISSNQTARLLVPVSSEDEVAQLIHTFNRLLDTLTQRESALKKSEFFARAMFAVEVPIFIASRAPISGRETE
ncbi:MULTISPECIES: HAMP domain-containing protein [unclassified Undibacterium]|uniref:HAMP domain-containing protein n=1 Tax=unclassified Undibacterium TaxID=2630295 RepID=UPI002AC96845|nr:MULTISPECIES: HAMP domain-containing protein [unclassified Undibacterium]MEB0141103.1 HAMP domain-containing protein [Undibacterium sp. CCC2.1]MEB0174040.1 HAMP domain-containing protein [Undibacterium sp. CCC1.1]MEB0178009.1 HAMP domain-containing protein [Undibacterium sp. CCC3.4]MEB0217295.1 HAMP domain-containing protein [Undibacterium sp. 5I2]WPX42821.1 HAMP domain-containing protein [Undibacterium sp. CCC3.4]